MARKTGFEVDEEGQIDRSGYAERARRKDKQQVGTDMSDLAQRLLDVRDLEALPMTGQLREAIVHARGISKPKARARQMKFVARLLRAADIEALEEALGESGVLTAEQEEQLVRLERWRTRILDDDEAIAAFASDFPLVDRQRVRQLARQYRAEDDSEKRRRLHKQLFQALKAATEAA